MARARRRTRTTADATAAAPFTVVIDTREQTPWDFTGIKADGAAGAAGGCVVVPVLVAGLPSGDYSLDGYSDRIAVERKSKADLFGTLGQGRDRFERELERLNAMAFAAVIVEAEISEIFTDPPPHTALKPKTISRSVIAWQQRYPRVHWSFLPGRYAAMVWGYRVLERWWRDEQERRKESGQIAGTTTEGEAP
jgi:DNA excision repair protein ERCC-4